MFKKIIIFCLGLGVLAAIAISLFLWNINPIIAQFKPQIAQIISSQIKQPVNLGEIEVQLFPRVGLIVQNVSLDGVKDSQTSIKKLMLETGIGPLLKGQVVVNNLVIEGAKLSFTRSKNGSISLGGIELTQLKDKNSSTAAINSNSSAAEITQVNAPDSESSKNIAEEKTNTSTTPKTINTLVEEEKTSIALEITSASLRESNIIFQDNFVSPAQQIEINDINASITNIGASEPGDLKFSASFLGVKDNNISLDGKVQLPPGGIGIPQLNLTLAVVGIDLTKISTLAGSYGIDINQLGAKIGESLSFSTHFEISNRGIISNLAVDGSEASLSFAEIFQKSKNVPLKISIEVAPTLIGHVEIKNYNFTLGDFVFEGSGSRSSSGDIKGAFKSKTIALADISQFFPIAKNMNLSGELLLAGNVNLPQKTIDQKQFTSAINSTLELKDVGISLNLSADSKESPLIVSKVNGKLEIANDSLNIKPFSLTLADQKLDIAAKVVSLSMPTAAFAIKSDRFEFAPIIKSIATDGLNQFSTAYLSQLNLTGTYSIPSQSGDITLSTGQSSIAEIPIGSLKLETTIKAESITLKPSSLSIFGGQIGIEANLGRDSKQALKFSARGRDLDLAQICKTAIPKSTITASGKVTNLSADIGTSLNNPVPSLAGRASMQTEKGSIQGFNLLGETLGNLQNIPGLDASLKSLIPEEYQAALEGDATAFDSFTSQLGIKDQQIDVLDLALSHSLYVISAKGSVRFNGDLNLKASLSLSRVLTEKMVLREPKMELLLDSDRNVVIPITISKTGNGRTIVLPDSSELLKRAASNTATKAAGRALEKIAPELKGAEKLIEGLFK